MIKVKEYRGHIRNWEELCERLDIPLDLTREEREEQILVKAYETWGNEMADHMHGMFAFALWDEAEEKLFCLRDQFGTKPFYYYETADGKLLYGTTIRKIMEQPGFVKELNEEMLQLYLSLTYVAGENTFFRGLKKLLPGRYLVWQNGKLTIERGLTHPRGCAENRQVLAGLVALLVRFAGAAALEFRNNPRRSPVSQPRRFVPAYPDAAL